jgi:hypothetical protein
MKKECFKKLFPHLVKEMNEGRSKAPQELISNNPMKRHFKKRKWSGYEPDIVDFIRRCDKAEQAEEIIKFMEIKGEITKEYSNKLINQLSNEGLRSFGRKKEDGFYHSER